MQIVIIILIAIVVLIGVAIIVINRKRHTSLIAEEKNYEKLLDTLQAVDDKLDEISNMKQNNDTNKVLETYTAARNECEEVLDRYDHDLDELSNLNSIFKYKQFYAKYEEATKEYDELNYKLRDLLKRVSSYAKIATVNQNIHYSIMSGLKELRTFFDTHLRVYECFNNDFESLLADINNSSLEYSQLTEDNEFYKARENVVSNYDQLKHLIDYTHKLASLFQVLTVGLPNIISTINLLVEQIKERGYSLKINNLDDILVEINMNQEMLMSNLKGIQFKEMDTHKLLPIRGQIEELVETTTNILNEIDEQATAIETLMTLESENESLIDRLGMVFEEALVEVNDIRNKYNIDTTDQMLEVERLDQLFNAFLADYERLVGIVHNAKEDFDHLITRTRKAQHFLKHINNDLKTAVGQLRGIRIDEIRGQDVLNKYANTALEIELYLRRNHHFEKVSPSLRDSIVTVINLYNQLQRELDAEKINLSTVTSLTDKINKQFDKLLGTNDTIGTLRSDVIRRKGCESLIKYIGLCSAKAGNNHLERSYEELLLMYKNHDYERCSGLARQILESNYKRGRDMYVKVTDQDKLISSVKPFAPVLLNSN